MKTKFILHGGYAGDENLDNDAFFKEILKDTPPNITILLVLFAKTGEGMISNKEKDINQFLKNGESKNMLFEVADEKLLIEQILKSDIIYLQGGETLKLLNVLKSFKNLRESISGKIVAGESAGAYVLSTCFYSKTEMGVFNGLGFVPVKTICHYEGKNEKKLNECPANLETLLLSSYKYKVFEI